MITLLYGPNRFFIQRHLSKVQQEFVDTHGVHGLERYDGDDLSPETLPELLQSVSLFTPSRLLILKDPSHQKAVWDTLATWAERVADSDDLHLVLVETAPDKRTKTFKTLQSHAVLQEAKELHPPELAAWLQQEAKRQGSELGRKEANLLVERAGTDQERLWHELEKLLLHDVMTPKLINELVEPIPQATAFELLDAILSRKPDKTKAIITELRTSEDPYKFFGLLASQVFALALVVAGKGKPSQQIAKDGGVHPFVVSKLSSVARGFSWSDIQTLVRQIATLDEHMKTRSADPWLQLETTCMKIATR